MEELVKARIQEAVNKLVRVDSNIGKELIETYKDALVDATCEIFAALSTVYDDHEEMVKRVEEFIKENFEDREKFNAKGYNTDSYMVAMIPVLLPIEAIAMVDAMEDMALPLILSQLSGYLLRTIIEIREVGKFSDQILEKQSEKIAEALKEKGWVA